MMSWREEIRPYIATRRKMDFAELESGMEYATLTRDQDGHPLMFIVARFWSVPFVTDSLFPAPTGAVPDDFLVWTF